MKIEQLYIRDFRNLAAVDLQPAAQLNVFTGANAQGKTNLLEAIQVLASGISFRRAADRDLLRHGAEKYDLRAEYCADERRFDTIMRYSPAGGRQTAINQKKTGLSHPDRLRVVSFIPDDLLLVKGSPERRRSFLDFLLRQLSAEYAHDLDGYIKILRTRNQHLKQDHIDRRQQAAIDEVYVDYGGSLILKRIRLVNILNDLLQEIFQQESGKTGELKLKYAISFRMNHDKINRETITAAFHESLEQLREEEERRRRSLAGPHLDDMNIYLNERSAGLYASQGQQRNIVISLKLAELYSIHRIGGRYPVFLLDEVLAELDQDRRAQWLARLEEAPFQSFLTSVNAEPFTAQAGRVWQVSAGQIKLREE